MVLTICELHGGRQLEETSMIIPVTVLCSRTCDWNMDRRLHVKLMVMLLGRQPEKSSTIFKRDRDLLGVLESS